LIESLQYPRLRYDRHTPPTIAPCEAAHDETRPVFGEWSLAASCPVIMLTPQGRAFDQARAKDSRSTSGSPGLVDAMVIDERIRFSSQMIWSHLTGGEIRRS
jgi:hypothetical protein